MGWEWVKPACEYPATGAGCSSSWELETGAALRVLQPTASVLFAALWLATFRPLARCWRELKVSRQSNAKKRNEAFTLRFWAAGLLALASPCAAAFVATGFLVSHDLKVAQGKLCYVLMNSAISLYFAATGCVILLFRNVLACKIQIKVQGISPSRALAVYAIPYAVILAILDLLVVTEVYTDPIVAYRIGLGCTMPSVLAFVLLMRKYGAPVVKAVFETRDQAKGSPAVCARLNSLVQKLEFMMRITKILSVTVLLLILMALTNVAHIPVVALLLFSSMWLGVIPAFHLAVLRDLSKRRRQHTRTRPFTSTNVSRAS